MTIGWTGKRRSRRSYCPQNFVVSSFQANPFGGEKMTIQLFLIIWLHFIGDFVLQSDKMAIHKGRSVKFLGLHCLVYSVPLFLFGWQFAIVNGFAHFAVDFGTSRLSGYYFSIKKRHAFIVTIGFDQAIHMSFLVGTLLWLT